MKDIFIDNSCAAEHFCNPTKDEYKELIKWIITFNEGSDENAFLVVSRYLLNEYYGSAASSPSNTSMPAIIDLLTRQGRLNSFTKKEIDDFQRKYFTKNINKKLRCNHKDRFHIPIILMSERKLAISKDVALKNDVESFLSFSAIIEDCPTKINYK